MVRRLPGHDLGGGPPRQGGEPFETSHAVDPQFLFFAVFSVIGKTSSFIGPFVSSAIIDRSGNNNMPFTFLLALGALAMVILFMVNVDKSRVECRKYLDDEAVRIYKLSSLHSDSTIQSSHGGSVIESEKVVRSV